MASLSSDGKHRLNEDQKEVELCKNFQAPFEILNKYRSQMKRLRSDYGSSVSSKAEAGAFLYRASSATSIMRIARMKQLQQKGKISEFSHENANKHLKLATRLLDAAECFSLGQYGKAEKLLISIMPLASHPNHAIERVVKYFAEDLKERIIDLEREAVHFDVDEAFIFLKAKNHVCEQRLPFTQITHFTAIQTILDSVALAKRVHFIDIGIKLGSHWIVMMHALKDSSIIEQLKITAVCTSEDNIEETGKILSSFAESMNLNFVFKVLYSQMHEIKKDLFELEEGETVALYMELCLTSLSPCPKNMEDLIGEIKGLNPCVMVVNEVESNVNGLTFIDRFHEAVFLCSAEFDCLEDCLHLQGVEIDQYRNVLEKLYFHGIIKNGVMSEEDESFRRNCKIDFWREFFGRFGIVEIELSEVSIYQAILLLKEFDCWRSCTLSMNGKSMLLGWNMTPLRSVSAWKFQHD